LGELGPADGGDAQRLDSVQSFSHIWLG
jgi:hypothetical protein